MAGGAAIGDVDRGCAALVTGGFDQEVIFLLNAVAFDEGDYEAAGGAVIFFERPAIGRVVLG